jgi:hypothetical protein
MTESAESGRDRRRLEEGRAQAVLAALRRGPDLGERGDLARLQASEVYDALRKSSICNRKRNMSGVSAIVCKNSTSRISVEQYSY